VIAPDTNVLVRLLVVDDPDQTTRACSMFEQGDILILKTVLLEAEWVLRSRYVLERDHIAAFFRNLSETDGIGMEHEEACRAAVAAYAGGMGFADALHAASAATMNMEFHTFDAALVGKAEKLLGISVQML
jgi:predicted nucleic-acid-binding protein